MSVIQHPLTQYASKRAELTRIDEIHFSSFIRLSTYLARYPSNLLTPSELRVLLFILGRTLIWKKRADNIAFRHFLEGVYHEDLVVSGPTGLAKQAVRDAIDGLRNKQYLVIHSFKTGNTEYHWRFYEPMVGKLLEDLTAFSSKKVLKPLPAIDPPPSRSPGDINNRNKNNLSSDEDSAASPPTVKGVRRMKPSSRIGKVAIDCNLSAVDQVKAIADQYKGVKSARVAANTALPKNRWNTTTLQALLDKARDNAQDAGYRTSRIVVTSRFINTLHERMVAHQITDPVGFFTWVLQNWEKVASANRRAKATQAKQTKASASEMSMAPNWNDLALRAPYFFPFYNDREQVAINEERKTVEKAERVATTKEASSSYLQTRREIVRQQDLEREAKRAQEAAPRRTRRAVPVYDFNDNEEAPQYRGRKPE